MSFLEKHYGKGEDPQVRYKIGQLAGAVTVLSNLMLSAIKIIAALVFVKSSVSLLADGFNSLGDAASGVISFLAFKMAKKPADEKHPYGHGRYEYIAALAVSIFILLIGMELFESGVKAILSPTRPIFSLPLCLLLVFSLLTKVFLMIFNIQLGKYISSAALINTGKDSRNDILCTLAVLISAIFGKYTDLPLDGIMAIGISIFIFFSGISLLKETVDPLLGCVPSEEKIENLKNKILSYNGVLGTHDLLLHDYGVGNRFASCHIELSSNTDTLFAHRLIDRIERDVEKEFGIHLVAHFDPIEHFTVEGALQEELNQRAKSLHPDISVHDLYIEHHDTCSEVHLDCYLPKNCTVSEEDVRKDFNSFLSSKNPSYILKIHTDRSYLSGS